MNMIYFHIDNQKKCFVMHAAKRQPTDLTKLMRQRAEILAEEEHKYQQNTHQYWLEKEIERAIANCEREHVAFIDHQQSNQRMALLRRMLTTD